MTIGVLKETAAGERRVALVPASIAQLSKAGIEVVLEPGAGAAAGFSDASYQERGATVAAGRDELFSADALVQVRSLGTNLAAGEAGTRRGGGLETVQQLGLAPLRRDLGEPAAADLAQVRPFLDRERAAGQHDLRRFVRPRQAGADRPVE